MRMSQEHSHHHRHPGFSYPVSLAAKLYSMLLGPAIVIGIIFLVLRFFPGLPDATETISLQDVVVATVMTMLRLAVAYGLAVVVAVPLALFATSNKYIQNIFLPFFDILESIPVLAFFPVLILIFVRFNFLNGAAIFILFLAMLWNLVFTLVGGINVIPKDLVMAAKIFNIKGFAYVWKIVLPSLFPQLVTGSILAVAQGWNITIVAEVLHVYIPNGNSSQDLFGIGSLMVQAASSGQENLFIISILAMTLAIAFLNFFVWQKLLHYAQRFKFE